MSEVKRYRSLEDMPLAELIDYLSGFAGHCEYSFGDPFDYDNETTVLDAKAVALEKVKTLQARVEELEGALQEVKNLCRMDSTNPTIRSLHSWVSEALEADDDNT